MVAYLGRPVHVGGRCSKGTPRCCSQITHNPLCPSATVISSNCRWVYLDGLRSHIPTLHSAILCFMVGPLGVLSHLLTKYIVGMHRSSNAQPSAA